ncbi:DUF58 domain-containing protein [Haloferula sp. BvORR071]|uniref:DUF58 domain-containing protein n=1 Tax=Haloferula sp. BvORR071 TaxID=1396141 RepID=UPI000A6D68B1|nr:DUF58 domain-containing protein [Haloferula sp. BvORR071]
MNEAILPSMRATPPPEAPGVYADLGELMRLRYRSSGLSFLPRQPLHSILAGRHASRLRGRGLNFEEIRRYLPGDDIRQMDWKVTARTRVPHTRVYTEEHGRTALLVVDQRLSMFFGSKTNFKSVTAAEAAALAAWTILGMKDEVAGIVFGDAGFEALPAGGSNGAVMRLLGKIVEYNRALSFSAGIRPAPEMLNVALHRAEQLAKHDTLVILVSDGSGGDGETNAVLSRIAAHNDVMVVLIHDPLEMDLPKAGPRVFAAGDLQLEADTSKKSLRETFHDDFQERLEAAKHFLIQREVPIMPISTDEDVAKQVRRLLGQARRR